MTQPGRAPRGAGGARSAGHAGGRRSLRPTAMAFLATFALVLAAACGAPPGGPGPAPTPDENGRPIVITSPRDGGRVSGAVFFAAQPLEPVPLADVALFVGGERVHPTFPGESPLRVYLIPRDHPEGPLQLRARVRVGGATFEDAITVQVVHEPPSTATVGAGGALLGDREANGAVSTVAIPPGVAGGATMSFAAFSQDEVKAETGVDYDALGVTFLGAQRIDGSAPTGDRVLMTSGGFGPMVQPGQTVVSYRITGDLGRGTGELMVINGASVAPNGDVVSNPAARPQAGATVASSVLGVTASATPFLLEGLPPGPPGTRLAFTVTGINHLATYGYAVRFRRAGGVVGEVPALVGLGGDGRQYLLGHVPSMAAGDVNVELVALAGDEVFARYTMRVTAAPPVPADPKGLVDLALSEILDLADALDDAYLAQGIELDLDPLRAVTQTARAGWAARPASDPELQAVARLLAGGGQVGSLAGAREVPSVTPSSGALCLLLGFKYVFDRDFHARAFQDGDLYSVGFRAISSSLTFDHWDKMADRLEDTPFDCDPIAKELCEAGIGPGCGDDTVTPPDAPNDWRPRPDPRGPDQNGPRTWWTGMGSIVAPPGGPVGGGAGGGGPGGSALSASSLRASALLPFEDGRLGVRALVNGQPWPFATTIRSDGYFYLPTIPVGLPTTLVVTDRVDFRECAVSVSGRATVSAKLVYLDLDACLGPPIDPGDYTIVWVGDDGDVDGAWLDPANWSPARVPNADDDVLIPSVTNVVRLPTAAAAASVRSLDVRGRLVARAGALTVTGDADVAALSSVHLSGTTSSLAVGGTLRVTSIEAAGNVTLDADTLEVGALTLTTVNGRVRLPAGVSMTVTGGITWSGGMLEGDGTTVLAAGSVSRKGGTGLIMARDGHLLDVRGRLDVESSASLENSASLHVREGGEVRLVLAAPPTGGFLADMGLGTPGGGGTIVNDGLITVRGDGVRYRLAPRLLHNRGVIAIEAGATLRVGDLTTHQAEFHNEGAVTGAGAFVFARALANRPFRHDAGATLAVPSVTLYALLDGANLQLAGTIATDHLTIHGGRARLPGDLALLHLTLDVAGTLEHDGLVTVATQLDASASRNGFAGTGTTVVGAGATAQLANVAGWNVVIGAGHTLRVLGTATWLPGPSAGLAIEPEGELHVVGTFVVQNDLPVTGGGAIRNAGTIRKEIATGTSDWTGACYVAEGGGAVVLDAGAIDLGGGC